MDFNQIVLTLIVFAPVTAAVIIFLTPKEQDDVRARGRTRRRPSSRWCWRSTCLWPTIALRPPRLPAAGYQFQALLPWVPSLGISYHVGVDGIGLVMVLLTGVVGFMGVHHLVEHQRSPARIHGVLYAAGGGRLRRVRLAGLVPA